MATIATNAVVILLLGAVRTSSGVTTDVRNRGVKVKVVPDYDRDLTMDANNPLERFEFSQKNNPDENVPAALVKADSSSKKTSRKSVVGRSKKQDPAAKEGGAADAAATDDADAAASAAEEEPAADATADTSADDDDIVSEDGANQTETTVQGESDEYELDLAPCCEYSRMVGKKLAGKPLVSPKDTLERAQELCDAMDECMGVVRMGNSSRHAGKFALKGASEVETDSSVWAILYSKGPCEEVANCTTRGEQNATDDNTTNATTTNATCVTRHDPRATSWYAETAPDGTPCVFGADPRDEGRHCIFEDGSFGSFGWCYTKSDQSQWGSCCEKCPLIGAHKVLGSKLDEISNMMNDMKGFLTEKFGPSSADENATNSTGNVTITPAAKPALLKVKETSATRSEKSHHKKHHKRQGKRH